MNLRINSCGIHDCPPEWEWITSACGFADYDVWAVFRGKGSIAPQTPGASPIYLREGSALLLTPGVQYIARHDPQHPLFVVNIHFDFLSAQGEIIHPLPMLVKSVEKPDFLKTLLIRTVTLFSSNQAELACDFLSAALAEYKISDDSFSAEAGGGWLNMIQTMTAEIGTAKKAPSLFEYAVRFGYTERYVGRMFRTVTGVSYSEYINNIRISKAKDMLLNTEAPIRQIAEETGFFDACYFSKVFSQTVGMPPSLFRSRRVP